MRDLMCSFHTNSGVMPGGPVASRFALAERLDACAAAGYSGYWLHWRDYLEQRAGGMTDTGLRQAFDNAGMRLRGVEFFSGWFLDGDAAAAEAERASFDAANAIGATTVNVGADFERRGLPRGHMTDRFAELCERAAARGLRVGLEIVPWSDVADLDTALAFLGSPNAGLVIDSWHIFRGGIPLGDLARIPSERVFCIQVNDAAAVPEGTLLRETGRRLLCGEGGFDLSGFAAAIVTNGWQAPVSVEIISPVLAAMPLRQATGRSFETARSLFV
ncbi:MAG: sugar phosphate isomerase/epimerase [Rhizobiaceae bacterium]|nr:sugar phosphate isomerase/epimerase [Rhizobiaceae bacterium]